MPSPFCNDKEHTKMNDKKSHSTAAAVRSVRDVRRERFMPSLHSLYELKELYERAELCDLLGAEGAYGEERGDDARTLTSEGAAISANQAAVPANSVRQAAPTASASATAPAGPAPQTRTTRRPGEYARNVTWTLSMEKALLDGLLKARKLREQGRLSVSLPILSLWLSVVCNCSLANVDWPPISQADQYDYALDYIKRNDPDHDRKICRARVQYKHKRLNTLYDTVDQLRRCPAVSWNHAKCRAEPKPGVSIEQVSQMVFWDVAEWLYVPFPLMDRLDRLHTGPVEAHKSSGQPDPSASSAKRKADGAPHESSGSCFNQPKKQRSQQDDGGERLQPSKKSNGGTNTTDQILDSIRKVESSALEMQSRCSVFDELSADELECIISDAHAYNSTEADVPDLAELAELLADRPQMGRTYLRLRARGGGNLGMRMLVHAMCREIN